MNQPKDPFFFPPGFPAPEPLRALLHQCPGLLGGQVSGSFAFRFESPENVARYFGDTGNASASIAAQHLGVFGVEPDGSTLAVWRAPQGGFPVVYMSSEGGGRALAADMTQFLRLLAVGYDEFSLWDDLAGPPESRATVSPLFLGWVAARGLTTPATGEAIADEAERRWPDFNGWMEDAIEDRLQDARPAPAPPDAAPEPSATPSPEVDIWTQMQSCLGERIGAPIVADLLQKLGLKPLKPGTPHNRCTYVSSGGIEVSAEIDPRYRPLFPPRKQGRLWLTYVTDIFLEPKSLKKIALPDPLSWKSFPGQDNSVQMLTQPVSGRCEITFMRDDEGIGVERIRMGLPQELDFITAREDYENGTPLVYVEDAFFATWCALHGLLDAGRYPEPLLQPWRQRERSPLQLLRGPCRRLLWSSDIGLEYVEFVKRYYSGFEAPESERWVSDIKAAFGSANHFREPGEPATPDDWASYDRIAAHIDQRFAAWREGHGA